MKSRALETASKWMVVTEAIGTFARHARGEAGEADDR
jgi:hypothetical protein